MISFVNEALIYTGFGLIVPIVIHLLSNRVPKTKLFSSLQFMDAENAVEVRSLRFSEPLLFFLRVLSLIFITLYLMNLLIHSEAKRDQHYILIENALVDDNRVQELIGNFDDEKMSIRRLQYGFPDLSKAEDNEIENYWHLLRELNEHPVSEVTLISHQKGKNFPSPIPSYPFSLKFIPIDAAEESRIHSISEREDSLFLRILFQNTTEIQFERQFIEKERNSRISVRNQNFDISYDPIKNLYLYDSEIIPKDSMEWIYLDQSLLSLKKYFVAAIDAINQLTQNKFKIVAELSEQVHWHIGASNSSSAQKMISIKLSEVQEKSFFKETKFGYDLVKSPELSRKSPVLESAFASELFSMLQPLQLKHDSRQIQLEEIAAKQSNQPFIKAQNYNQLILILLSLIIALERYLSLKKGLRKDA